MWPARENGLQGMVPIGAGLVDFGFGVLCQSLGFFDLRQLVLALKARTVRKRRKGPGAQVREKSTATHLRILGEVNLACEFPS